MNDISLCLIVKDEEEHLSRCLSSALSVADEIIVVDTGSSDRSVEIAKSFGARVYHHPWEDDFAKAKNQALQYATKPWILWLDADEEIQPGGAELIREAVQKPKVAGFHLAFTNILDHGKIENFLLPRLFINHPEVRWVNVIHEQIFGPLQTFSQREGLSIETCPAQVFHYGYLTSVMQNKKKNERMQRLFQKQLSLYPDDPYSWYKYGDFLRQENRDRGVAALQKSFELLKNSSSEIRSIAIYAADAAAILATELQALGLPQRATLVLQAAESLELQLTPNYFFGKACILRNQERYAAALKCFQKCLSFANISLPIASQWGVTGPLAYLGIAECHSSLGNLQEAEAAYRSALEAAPQHLPIVFAFCNFYLRQNRKDDALELLELNKVKS